jgi:hypothetical protein
MSFLRILSSLMRTWGGFPGRSPIAAGQTRLTSEFFYDRISEKKLQLVGMYFLSIQLSLRPRFN